MAASSFSMKITDPRFLLDAIDRNEFNEFRQRRADDELVSVTFIEPVLQKSSPQDVSAVSDNVKQTLAQAQLRRAVKETVIKGKSIIFGDDIDTDAVC